MSDVHIITQPLGGSLLSLLLQRDDAPVSWTGARPRSTVAWRAIARARGSEADWSKRWDALLPAIMPAGAAAARLERVSRQGGVVVTTGQQPGLFGGPLYTWSKAMSALALADELEARTGIPTAAVFWAATDDADFAEAAATVVARSGGVDELRATLAPAPGTPMSRAPLGDLREVARRLEEACGSGADPRSLLAAVEAYGDPARSHGEAFVTLLRTLLAPLGMPVLDASHDAVRSAGAATIRVALDRASDIETSLSSRASEIRAIGLDPQVDDVPGLALVFASEGSGKRRLTIAEAGAQHDGLSPNVLLRPIVERAILPTVAYVAGPGELAYFAQVTAVAAAMGVPSPVAVPRWSCSIVEPRVQSLLDRVGITIADLDDVDAVEGRIARAAMRDDARRALEEMRLAIASLPAGVAVESEALGLTSAVEGATRSLQHRLDRLDRRIVAAIKRRDTARMRDVATLRGALRPNGARQERVLNAIPLLTRNGCELLADMHRAAGPHAALLVGQALDERSPGAST